MQYKIPQDVQREDKLVGPLTLRQLVICGIGGMICYAIFNFLAKDYIWVTYFPPILIIALITVIFAFVRPYDLRFERFIVFYLEYIILPKKRYWIKASAEPLRTTYTPIQTKKQQLNDKSLEKLSELETHEQKVKKLSELIDNKYKP